MNIDLKATNILMSFEDLSVVEEYVAAQADHPILENRQATAMCSCRTMILAHLSLIG